MCAGLLPVVVLPLDEELGEDSVDVGHGEEQGGDVKAAGPDVHQEGRVVAYVEVHGAEQHCDHPAGDNSPPAVRDVSPVVFLHLLEDVLSIGPQRCSETRVCDLGSQHPLRALHSLQLDVIVQSQIAGAILERVVPGSCALCGPISDYIQNKRSYGRPLRTEACSWYGFKVSLHKRNNNNNNSC